MATQTAMISIGLTMSAVSKKSGRGTAQLQCGALEAATNYTGGSGLISRNRIATQLPPARVPLGRLQEDGVTIVIEKAWYDALDYVFNRQLGGIAGPSLSDITTTVDSTRTSAIDAQTAVSQVAATVNANAEALSATVQVTQNSSLPGATQIPPVVRAKGALLP